MFRKLSTEEIIIKERIELLNRYPFFGYLALGLKLVEKKEFPTMATDGKHLYYNPEFVNRIPPDQLRGVIVHEILHCAFEHLWRIGSRDPTKWNYATDYAINLIVTDEGFALPPNILLDTHYRDMSAERIYDILPDPKFIEGELLDSHDMWPGEPNDKGQRATAEGGGKKDSEPVKEPGKAVDVKDMAKEWKERLVRAANAARSMGKLPGSMDSLVADILEPKLDWTALLRDKIISSVKNDYRFYPPSKKYLWNKIYMPSIHGERLEIAIGIDTSGSISNEDFQRFMAEIRGITEQYQDYLLHIFLCDTTIHDYIPVGTQDDWPKSFHRMGGGTAFEPVFYEIDARQLQISTLVYLTDGIGSYPKIEPEYPVIWLLNREYELPVSWGEKIVMDPSPQNR